MEILIRIFCSGSDINRDVSLLINDPLLSDMHTNIMFTSVQNFIILENKDKGDVI